MMDDQWVYTDDGRQQFNATVLSEYGYVIYPNNTISNATNCFLAFGDYVPTIISNGSVFNSSGCDTPVRGVRSRGALGIVMACVFGFLLVLVCACLKNHGESYLPAEKRFRLVGRRWPWYWLIITTTCGLISGFSAIDIDRAWVPGTSAILSFIFYLMTLPTCLAAIWETTRNWSSFLERQGVDEDFFKFRPGDRRSTIEFYMPFGFYVFTVVLFFLEILRSWTPLGTAYPGAEITDVRFKASSIIGFISWLVIVACFVLSLYYYKPGKIAWKIPISLFLILIRIAYNICSAFDFSVSQLRYEISPAYIYLLGYLPVVLVVGVLVFFGFREPNEDREIIRQRTLRNREFEAEMGNLKETSRRKSSVPSSTRQPSRVTRKSVTNDYWSSGDPSAKV